jgi:transglutaminase-like putative cysteine protease
MRDTVSASEWILENRLPSSKDTHKRALARGEAVRKAALADSMQPYLASNDYLVLEDSLLRDAALKAARAGSVRDPKAMAGNIREWVTRGFRFQLGAVLFGNSREVLRNMTGDCSEAAILTAALLRASGVPSRVAMGFASAGRGVFIGHAWTEAWLGDDLGWVGVDAALGQFPAGEERIKLMHLDGASDMRIAATNLMLASLSNLDIEILEARKGTREIPLVEHPGAAGEGARFFADILKGFGEGR